MKNKTTDAALEKRCTVLGGMLDLGDLLAAEEHVIVDAISKVDFWRRRIQKCGT